jgi:hypothetical protein
MACRYTLPASRTLRLCHTQPLTSLMHTAERMPCRPQPHAQRLSARCGWGARVSLKQQHTRRLLPLSATASALFAPPVPEAEAAADGFLADSALAGAQLPPEAAAALRAWYAAAVAGARLPTQPGTPWCLEGLCVVQDAPSWLGGRRCFQRSPGATESALVGCAGVEPLSKPLPLLAQQRRGRPRVTLLYDLESIKPFTTQQQPQPEQQQQQESGAAGGAVTRRSRLSRSAAVPAPGSASAPDLLGALDSLCQVRALPCTPWAAACWAPLLEQHSLVALARRSSPSTGRCTARSSLSARALWPRSRRCALNSNSCSPGPSRCRTRQHPAQLRRLPRPPPPTLGRTCAHSAPRRTPAVWSFCSTFKQRTRHRCCRRRPPTPACAPTSRATAPCRCRAGRSH